MLFDMDTYRPWFAAAAAFNFVFGSLVVLVPGFPLTLIGVVPPDPIALWQVVGMMILVFAPAYWWASRDPWAHRHFVLIGTVAKVFGVTGFVIGAATGQLPLSFGWVSLFGDLIWLPAFLAFVLLVVRQTGWRAMLVGE